MKRSWIRPLLAVVVAVWCVPAGVRADRRVAVVPAGRAAPETEARWLDSFDNGLTLAQRSGRYMLVNFGGSDWCGWCQKLDREVFQSDEFKAYAAANLVLVDLDSPTATLNANPPPHAELKAKYAIKGFPTVLILNPAGELVHRTGYVAGGGVAFVAEISPHVKRLAKPVQSETPEPELPALPKDWEGFRAALAALDPAEARGLFVGVVNALVKAQSEWMPAKRVYVDDFCAICDALPVAPERQEIDALASLLSAINGRANQVKRLNSRLETGLRYFGGEQAQDRYRAADLLFAAGLQGEASAFLDPLEQVQDADLDIVDLHLDVWLKAPVAQRSIETTEAIRALLVKRIRADASTGERVGDDVERLFELMISTGEVNSEALVEELVTGRPALATVLLVKAAERQRAVMTNKKEAKPREQAFLLRRSVTDGILKGDAASPEAAAALDALAWMWVDEVRGSLKSAGQTPSRSSSSKTQRDQVVSAEVLRASAPTAAFKALLAEELNREILKAEIQVLVLQHRAEEAVERIVALQRIDSDAAAGVAAQLLSQWGAMFDGKKDRYSSRDYGGFSGRRYMRSTRLGGQRVYPVPVTNARRERMKQKLAATRIALVEAGVELEQDQAWITAFASCYLGNQVFRVEDVERVFGMIDDMPPSLVQAFADDVLGRLGRQWKLTDEELEGKATLILKEKVAKMREGYALGKRILDSATRRFPDNYPLFVTYGALLDAEAEAMKALSLSAAFADELKGVAYRGMKEAAIEALLGAAAAYGPEMEQMLLQSEVPRLVQFLFFSAVTALDTSSDLGEETLEAVRSLITSVPESHREATMQVFADWARSNVARVPPDRKYHWLQQAQRVVGDVAGVSSIREKIALYDEVLNEVALHIELDGPGTVGVGQPFGVVLSVRHSEAFAVPGNGVSGFMAKVLDSRSGSVDYQELHNIILFTLQDQFDVDSVTFRSGNLPAFAYGRPGWREAPLAYIVLSARSTAADRVPPIQFDFQFNGSEGHIVVPVRSSPVMIGVEEQVAARRPVEQVEVIQTLDERNLANGVLSLELIVKGRGLIPAYDSLFGDGLEGCREISRTTDGLHVKSLDVTENGTSMLSERSWVLELAVDPANVPDPLTLPLCTLEGAQVTYQHYVGSDIESMGRDVALGTLAAAIGRRLVMWGTAVVVLLLVGGFLARRLRAANKHDGEQVAEYSLPADLNAFTVLALLRRVQRDDGLRLDEQRRHDLTVDIDTILDTHFSAVGQEQNRGDLEAVAQKWLSAIAV